MTQVLGFMWVCLVAVVLFPARLALGNEPAEANSGFSLSLEQQTAIAAEANRLYSGSLSLDAADRKEQLERAYEKYRLLADTGQVRPELYFNLGNCALQLENYGHAVAYFEQARRLSPGDRAIQKNLRFARSKLDPEEPAGVWAAVSEFNLSAKPVAWWTAVASWCVLWGVVGLQLFRSPMPRSTYLWLRNGAVAVLLLASASLLLSERYATTFDAIVLQEEIELRQGDGEVFGSNGSLASGHRVRVIEQRGDWCKVDAVTTTGNSVVGWVQGRELLRLRG